MVWTEGSGAGSSAIVPDQSVGLLSNEVDCKEKLLRLFQKTIEAFLKSGCGAILQTLPPDTFPVAINLSTAKPSYWTNFPSQADQCGQEKRSNDPGGAPGARPLLFSVQCFPERSARRGPFYQANSLDISRDLWYK